MSDLNLDSPILKPFIDHGVDFVGMRDDQAYGTCPFTGKAEKFYVNATNGLWDSKTAGYSGNVQDFLARISEQYRHALTPQLLTRLAENRQLPLDAFKEWEFGWDGRHYTLPVRDPNGKIVDIRKYTLGKAFMSTAGCKVGLLGAEKLKGNMSEPVHICEGEWDCIALTWANEEAGVKGVVVGVPGAGTFKPAWVPWVSGRTVHTYYDNDGAGEEAELMIQKRLGSATRKLTFVHWPDDLPAGFDTRDWLIYGAVRKGDPKGSLVKLQRLFRAVPKRAALAQPDEDDTTRVGATLTISRKKNGKKASKKFSAPPTVHDIHKVFQKWLFLPNTDAIDVMLATVCSQRLEGDPAWVFLVGPPGSAKTALLAGLTEYDGVYTTSSLTPHTLVSGANGPGQVDPSLVPRLDGKVLVIKDFTVVLGMRDVDKEQIFDILRDAYDGKCAKDFGNGIIRRYDSRFTVLAAVTPAIYVSTASHTALGERFLKFVVADNLKHDHEEEIIARAIDNTEQAEQMKEEMARVTTRFLEDRAANAIVPAIPEAMKHRIIHLGMFAARLRGTVSRDTFNHDIMTSRPSAEVGSRLGIQLSKMARALAMVYGRSEVGDAEYRILRKMALDTVSQRVEDVLRCIWQAGAKDDAMLKTQEIAEAAKYPLATISRLLTDLHALEVVKRRGSGYRYQWGISDYISRCIREARLYETKEELARPRTEMITIRKKPKVLLVTKES